MVSPAFLQQFLETIHNFALFRTDGAGTPPRCSKLLARYVCTGQLLMHFFRVSWRDVTLRKVQSLFLSVMFLINDLSDSLI